jgi:hypothetical protein
MTKTKKLAMVVIGTTALALSWAAVGDAVTRSSTTRVGTQEPGSASVKCPKGETAVAANVVGQASSPPGPHLTVNTLARRGTRRVETKGYNYGDPGRLTAIARCKKRPKSTLVSATAPVPAATIGGNGQGTATARCPRGEGIVFGGFRAKRDPNAPDYVFIYVTSAMRTHGRSWTVHALNSTPDGSGTVEALAYCGDVGAIHARTDTIGLGQFEVGSAEATCPRGTKVRYGGFQRRPGTPGRLELNALKRSGERHLRVTGTEGFYLSPGDEMGLTAIAYCR